MNKKIILETRNRKSTDFDIEITKVNSLSCANRKVEKHPIQGKNGSLIIDTEAYEDFSLRLDCNIVTKKDIEEVSRDIKAWLKKDAEYLPIKIYEVDEGIINPSTTSNLFYEGYCANAIDIDTAIENFNAFLLIFNCMPLKKRSNKNIIVTEKNTVVSNLGTIESQPRITIKGSGDITLKINKQEVILKNVEGSIIIDSEIMNVHKIDTHTNKLINENQKIYSDFPQLELGNNIISWSGTGTVISVEIEPRFVEL